MSSVRRIIIWLIASVGVVLACVVSASAEAAGRPFTVDLTGAAEVNAGVPNQGDPDGTGTATLSINPGTGEVCWEIEVAGVVEPITAAHIHVGSSTTTGGVVVPLSPYTGGCDDIDRELALAILTDPGSYYVNVHNEPYPAGALRGQLAFAP